MPRRADHGVQDQGGALQPVTEPPGWVRRLADPSPGLVVGAAWCSPSSTRTSPSCSGLGLVLTADVTAGERGRARLRAGTAWLVRHNGVIGFGVLVAGRGLAQLA